MESMQDTAKAEMARYELSAEKLRDAVRPTVAQPAARKNSSGWKKVFGCEFLFQVYAENCELWLVAILG